MYDQLLHRADRQAISAPAVWKIQMKPLYVLLLAQVIGLAQPLVLLHSGRVPQVAFAASEIRKSCASVNLALVERDVEALSATTSPLRLVITSDPAEAGKIADSLGVPRLRSEAAQSYAIRRVAKDGRTTIAVLAADSSGAMYGGLDLAEAIRLGTIDSLSDSDHSPHIERRGIKFNVPLDVRTPSYSDNSDAAQNNIPEMWSLDFWREFIDEMARDRYNVLSLWNLHPFPSLVKVPEYPDVALEDVKRTRVPMDDTFSLQGSDMVRPAMLENMETVKKMSIGDKIAFWRSVMQYAHDRGIEVYWFTWNIFTFGAEGKYGITPEQNNRKTIDYFRASVRELVLTYPLLDGIGITAGEHMQERNDEFAKEKWLWNTYGQGIMDAKRLQPGRRIRLIHRYHQTGQSEILDAFKDYTDTFQLSFKYAIAHMYSIPNPPFIRDVLPNIVPEHPTWLTVRDDDVYSFRWGNLRYAREFVRNIPGGNKVAGFYMGPDGTIWGREFLSKNPEKPHQLVISKRWYSFMLWGRLTYEPDLPDGFFLRTIAQRFPEVPADTMAQSWSDASEVFPLITRFFWGDIDLRWFPEACLSHPHASKGFYTVKDFVAGQTMPGAGVLNLTEWRQAVLAGTTVKGITPLEIADSLSKYSTAALRSLPALRQKQGSNAELRSTLIDMESMAHLGAYYAAKIQGAADLALFDKTGKPEQRDSAIRHLRTALEQWKRYAYSYTQQYQQPKLYNRVGWVDIPGLTTKVEQDIAIAQLWAPGTVPDSKGPSGVDTPFRK